jgi:hypothetical protein
MAPGDWRSSAARIAPRHATRAAALGIARPLVTASSCDGAMAPASSSMAARARPTMRGGNRVGREQLTERDDHLVRRILAVGTERRRLGGVQLDDAERAVEHGEQVAAVDGLVEQRHARRQRHGAEWLAAARRARLAQLRHRALHERRRVGRAARVFARAAHGEQRRNAHVAHARRERRRVHRHRNQQCGATRRSAPSRRAAARAAQSAPPRRTSAPDWRAPCPRASSLPRSTAARDARCARARTLATQARAASPPPRVPPRHCR